MAERKQVKGFGNKLNLIRKQLGLTIQQMANQCGMSVSYLSNILHYDIRPSLDMLFSISEGLKLPFEEIAYLLTTEPWDSIDKGKYVMMMVLTNSRDKDLVQDPNSKHYGKKIDGRIVDISEQALIGQYGTEYSSEQFEKYVKRYIRDVLYKDELEARNKVSLIESLVGQEVESIDKEEHETLKALVMELSELDERGLEFIKRQINLYKTLF